MYNNHDEDEDRRMSSDSDSDGGSQDLNQEVDEFGNIQGSNSQALDIVDDEIEVIVAEEDTEPITQPIVKPLVIKRFSHLLSDDKKQLPRTTFDFKFMQKLMEQDHAIRNVAFIGNFLHGKTTLLDCMIERTHLDFENQNPERPIRFTDTLYAEQERGLSIKCSPVSIVYQNLRSKSYVLNMMDTPGHVNFSDEVTAALRLSDGVVLVVDAVEGILMNTTRLVQHAIREDMTITLCINKIDRLILELRLPPSDAYRKLKKIIEDVNALIDDETKILSPLLGNVCFASSQYSICFTLRSFAKLYLDRTGVRSITYKQFASKLWGDLCLDGETSKFVPLKKDSKRSFVEFILEPLYKFFRLAVEDPDTQFMELVEKYNIKLTKEQKRLNVRPLLKLASSQMFGSFDSLVDMIVEFIPTPKYNAASKCPAIWTGPLIGCELTKAIRNCDPNGPLVVQITKQYSAQDATSFSAFGLVLSGTLRSGTDVRVLGESYSTMDEEDSRILPVSKVWIYNSRYKVEVRSIPAGNWALIEGVDEPIVKTATIIDSDYHDELYIFRPLKFNAKPIIKLAVEPVNPSELPKMLEGLRKCNKSYPLLHTKVEASGEHVMMGSGELYLDCVMHDLRHMYSEIDIRVSQPGVCFSETVLETSRERCTCESQNGRNQLTMIAEPLDKNLDVELEERKVTLESDQREIDKFFKKRYDWDDLACRSIWAFGPTTDSTNILLNDTLPYEVDSKLIHEIKWPVVQAFHWATREGPLCEEPIRGVKFKLQHAVIAPELTNRQPGQIIPTARDAAFMSFLMADPHMMEPWVFVEIIAPPDVAAGPVDSSDKKDDKSIVNEMISRERRGRIVKRSGIPGTPLYKVEATMPAIESIGFETDLRVRTTGQAFCMSVFHDWRVVPGEPLDSSIDQYLLNGNPNPERYLAREFLLKTRRRKGLSRDVNIGCNKTGA